jgi:hypothetical protein
MNEAKTIPQARRKQNFEFLSNLLQGNRSKPKKFKHSLKMPFQLYYELVENKIFDPEDLYCNEIAFFSFSTELVFDNGYQSDEYVEISYISLFQIEDLHRKIDYYLIKKLLGFYPIKRFGIFF